ncbi:protein FAM3D-like [Lethenteron reissneri]|uniref:protein FAM3D-like n=1 Tax=Lethenteron reissneri TaxID=7753 RepID=UPI002AB7301C|nr:protein FAM3D-like [Lethenteron reissneri]
MRLSGMMVRVLVIAGCIGLLWLMLSNIVRPYALRALDLELSKDESKTEKKIVPMVVKNDCDMEKPCPPNNFAFRITSGAADVVGPNICFWNRTVMSSVLNNVGVGINIALINGQTGQVINTGHFDMWQGDIKLLIQFLNGIKEGTIVLLASFDDPYTKLNDEAKALFVKLGSSIVNSLAFRESWVFVGALGIEGKSPFEARLENKKETNKYDGWPEMVELVGCIPRKLT